MGYIPGLFVILGACFLWGILVHNTLKSKKDLLIQQLNKLKATVSERDRVLEALFNEIPPLDLAGINTDYLNHIEKVQYNVDFNFSSEELKATSWINKIYQTLLVRGYSEDHLNLLSEISSKVLGEVKQYKRIAKSYNALLESRPTAYMAKFLGFKKVAI